jgi:hypothetical protein
LSPPRAAAGHLGGGVGPGAGAALGGVDRSPPPTRVGVCSYGLRGWIALGFRVLKGACWPLAPASKMRTRRACPRPVSTGPPCPPGTTGLCAPVGSVSSVRGGIGRGGGGLPPVWRHPLLLRQPRRALRRPVHWTDDQRTLALQERGRRVGLFWTIEIPGDENQVNLGKGFASTPKPRVLAAQRPGTTGMADTHGYAS